MNILFINRNDSVCGACGRPADPYELAHGQKLGYNPGPGCGMWFTHVSSHYLGTEELIKEMRPDLVWIDPLEGLPGQRSV